MPTEKAKAADLDRKPMQFYLPAIVDDELNYLCRRQAERDGVKPDRLRSFVVRVLIRHAYHLEREREEAEHAEGSEK